MRQLLARCFSDGCFDRRLLGISAICLFTSCEIAPQRETVLAVFAQKQTDMIPTIKNYMAFVYLQKSMKQYKWTCSESDFFRHTRISFDIQTDLLLKSQRSSKSSTELACI